MSFGIAPRATGLSSLQEIQRRLTSSFERLSSGSRIPRASADAAGLAISERLRALTSSRSQGVRNLSDGISAARIAEGALNETSSILGRLRELSVQARNGTVSEGQREIIQQEFDSLTSEISRIAETTEFNGRKLLDGGTGAGTPLRIETAQGEGTSSGIELSVSDQSAAAIGVAGLDVADAATLDAIDSAIQSVSTARASIGTTENRFSSAVRTLRTEIENLTAAESRIRDVDVAKETSELTRNLLLKEFAIGVRAQANLNAGVSLRLLGGGR